MDIFKPVWGCPTAFFEEKNRKQTPNVSMDTDLVQFCFKCLVTDLKSAEKYDSKYVYMFGYSCRIGYILFKMHAHTSEFKDQISASFANCVLLPYGNVKLDHKRENNQFWARILANLVKDIVGDMKSFNFLDILSNKPLFSFSKDFLRLVVA